jgi:hypothetical protein
LLIRLIAAEVVLHLALNAHDFQEGDQPFYHLASQPLIKLMLCHHFTTTDALWQCHSSIYDLIFPAL